jgi:hypothetical protein
VTVQAKTDRIIPNVFHRDGDPIKSFRGAWFTACEAAGVPGRIFHDLRRTAVRNFERAGVPRSVAMKLTGHKTEAVYRRYAIVSDADLRDAADKLAAIAGPGTGTTTGTVTMIRRAAAGTVSPQAIDLVAEGEEFEPPRASRPGGFQVRPRSPLRMSSSCLMVSFRAVSSMSRPRERPVATDDDRCVRLRIRQRNGPRSFQGTGTGAALSVSAICAVI